MGKSVAILRILPISLLACLSAHSQEKPTPQPQPIPQQQQPQQVELNTELMESTFKIEGPGSMGTAFILGRPYADGKRWRYVLITAAHVLSDMQGETAVIHFRRPTIASAWETGPVPLRIRSGAIPLWKQHPNADVAVMYVTVPEGALPSGVISTTEIADDKALTFFGIHPGDEVTVLGYPLGDESKPFGFPILRTGRIASFPLLPTKDTKIFLLDFPVFPGNSGGPAYFIFGGMRGTVFHLGQQLAIVGLVSGEHIALNRIPLGIAEVVHGSFVAETIAMLPPPDSSN
jgi:S1-C subfamily serine protease